MEHHTIKKSPIRRNVIANYLGKGWIAIIGIAFVPIYIDFLGIEAYGLIGLFSVLYSWLTLLDMGLTPTLNREMARYTTQKMDVLVIRDLLRSAETISLLVALTISLTLASTSTWLATSWLKAENLSISETSQAFTIMGIIFSLRFIEGIYRGCLIGLQRQVTLNVIVSSMATIRALGAIVVLAWISPSIIAFFLWQLAVSSVTVLVIAWNIYKLLPRADRTGKFSILSLKRVWRFAGGMLGITFFTLILGQLDKIVLSKYLSLADYGYYMVAVVLAAAIFSFAAPIVQAWFPVLCQFHATNDEAGLASAYHQGAQLVSVMVGSVAVTLIVYPENLLFLWTHNPDLVESVAPLLRLLAVGNLLNVLMYIPNQTQFAHGWIALTLKVNIVLILFAAPAVLWATPIYGAEGAAIIWICVNLCFVFVAKHFMYRKILKKEKWRWYFQDTLFPILVAAAISVFIKWQFPTPTSEIMQFVRIAVSLSLSLLAAAFIADSFRRYILDFLNARFAT